MLGGGDAEPRRDGQIGLFPQGDDLALLREIWDDWKECELPQCKMKEAAE